MNFLKPMITALAAGLSCVALAAPQTGVWGVKDGLIFDGDLIHIEVQDDQVFLMMPAHDSVHGMHFLYGFGDLDEDDVSISLMASDDPNRRVWMTGHFDTSVHGSVTFEGAGTFELGKLSYADDRSPQSLFGIWTISVVSPQTGVGDAELRLFNSVQSGTENGTGIAVDSTGTLGCEYQARGELAGLTLCVDVFPDGRLRGWTLLRRSGNFADGVYVMEADSAEYLASANKITSSRGNFLALKTTPVAIIDWGAAFDEFQLQVRPDAF